MTSDGRSARVTQSSPDHAAGPNAAQLMSATRPWQGRVNATNHPVIPLAIASDDPSTWRRKIGVLPLTAS